MTRTITPRDSARRPLPRMVLPLLGGGAALAWIDQVLLDDGGLALVGFLACTVGACVGGAWAEARLYRGLQGAHPVSRLAVGLFAPAVVPVVGALVAGLVGSLLALVGGGPFVTLGLLAGVAWTTFAALGSAVMVVIDVGIRALLRGLRARVQAAVLGLVIVVFSASALITYGGHAFASELAEVAATGNLPSPVTLTVNGTQIAGAQAAAMLRPSFVTDVLTMVFVGVALAISVPIVLSACGKLADGVMERLEPLTQAIGEVAAGHLDVHVEERGVDDLRQLAAGFNGMTRALGESRAALEARNRELARLHEATSRFVPYQFLELLDRETVAEIHRGDQTALEISILFADIRGFTTLAEAIGPADTFALINRYVGHMEPQIARESGFISDFQGDGIMALFHVGADAAVRAGLGMLQQLVELNRALRDEGGPALDIGIGINTGHLMLGTIGGAGRLSCTVIGDPANTASRTEGMTKLYGSHLLITQDTVDRLPDRAAFTLREVDRVQAKGKRTVISIHEVLDGEPDAARAQKEAELAAFAAALTRYRSGDHAGALADFVALAERAPLDGAATLYRERCRQLVEGGLSDHWDGVTRLLRK